MFDGPLLHNDLLYDLLYDLHDHLPLISHLLLWNWPCPSSPNLNPPSPQPDHTEKAAMWSLLKVEEETGISLSESLAMLPAASVSGLYFAHPQSNYFSLGKIEKDQVEDYSQRKGQSVAVTERWLATNLSYEPEDL